ncbi:MAG TPA: transglycosylase SLT domain-containing protein [Desulfuromonadaceae bacterium]
MFQISHKQLCLALVGPVFISLAVVASTHADELFLRAAAQFQEKDFAEAYELAQKSADSSQGSFLCGVAALRLGKPNEALPLLAKAENKLPLVGDYAALYQAEALLKLKKYAEASAKAASIPKAYPASILVRKSEKLFADIFVEAEDYKGALKILQSFIEKYPSGTDSIEALYQWARCREETGDKNGAAEIYRGLWLKNPTASQSKKASERLKVLEKAGLKLVRYTPDELLRRAVALYSQNQFNRSLETLQLIPLDNQTTAFVAQVDLRSGMAQVRLRNFKQAEKIFAKLAASNLPGIKSEGQFWLAKVLERQDLNEKAFALYMELIAQGKKQEFSDDALMEAAGLRKGMGRYTEAAKLYDQLLKEYPESKFLSKAGWDSAWCRYLAGEYAVAAESLKGLLKDESMREKGLYWLARAMENAGNAEATNYYRVLLNDYPAGFYSTWYREQKGLKDERASLGIRNYLNELPLMAGFEKARFLASLGMSDEARSEVSAVRKKIGDKKNTFPGLARVYLEVGDYGSGIALFLQNRPIKWDKESLSLWTAGYPLVYNRLVGQHASSNALSEALVFALIRAESSFSPAVKSPAGAIGLMQLMPDTAKATAREKGEFNPQRLTSPEINIKLGTKHLRELLKGYDDDKIYAIAAYNAGATAVERWRKNLKGLKKDEFIESIPYQETRDYVKKVYASAATYRQLYGLR